MTNSEIMQCAATLAAGMISGNPAAYNTADEAVELMYAVYGIIKEDQKKYDE